MKETRQIMGMPVTIELVGAAAMRSSLGDAFDYFEYVDRTFSTYKEESEMSCVNRGEILPADYSGDMKLILRLAEKTKQETEGYFDIRTPRGTIDPSGIVKGWAVNNAARLLRSHGNEGVYVEAGGDIQTFGRNAEGQAWRIGIRNPFQREEIVKVVYPRGCGVATSGVAARGSHIYDPHTRRAVETRIVSITVIGPDVYEADRFATAAFAMGEKGIRFLENLPGFEAYAVDMDARATMTSGFDIYTYDQDN